MDKITQILNFHPSKPVSQNLVQERQYVALERDMLVRPANMEFAPKLSFSFTE